MRCNLSDKKVDMLRKKTGLDIVSAKTRGNTDHRIDLYVKGGKVIYLYRDGTLKESNEVWR